MNLNRLFILTTIFSILLFSCGKDNELTPNPMFDENASGVKTNNNGSGNDNGGDEGGGENEEVVSYLSGNFGGDTLSFQTCYFTYDNFGMKTTISATSADGNKIVNLAIDGEVTETKTYTVGVDIEMSYDYDLLNFSKDSRYVASSGSLTITSVDSTALKGTFFFNGKISSNPTDTITVKNGKFTAEKP